jgi:plastocyanin
MKENNMKQQNTRSFRGTQVWMTLVCLMVLAALMAACGDATPASNPGSSSGSNSVSTITITEKAGGHDIYSFDPQTLSIKAGTAVKWVNNSDENHLLISSPASALTATSMVPRSGSADNTYSVTFTAPGTYTITSKLMQREHNQPEGEASQATLTLTVS